MIPSAISGHLRLEQPPDEIRVRARQDDLDLAGGLLDVQDQAADPLAGAMRLAHDLLALGHEALRRVVQVDDQRPAFVADDGAADDLAFPLDELRIDAVSLIRPDLLDHDLLGGLGRDAAELLDVDRLAASRGLDLPGLSIDLNEYLAFGIAELLAHGRDHRLFEVGEDRLLVDILVPGDVIDDSQQFLAHSTLLPIRHPRFHKADPTSAVATKKKWKPFEFPLRVHATEPRLSNHLHPTSQTSKVFASGNLRPEGNLTIHLDHCLDPEAETHIPELP